VLCSSSPKDLVLGLMEKIQSKVLTADEKIEVADVLSFDYFQPWKSIKTRKS
jgi:hypothetical protein